MNKILAGAFALLFAFSASGQVYSRTSSGIDTNSVIGISTGILGTNTFGQIQMPGPTAWTTNWPGGTIGCVSNMVTAFTNGVLSWGTTGALQVLTAGFYEIGYMASFVDAASASTMRLDVFTNVAGGSPTSIGGGAHGTASTTTYGIWSRPSSIRYLPANTFVSLALNRISGTAGGGTISNAALSVVMLRNSTAGGTGASSTNTSSTITNVAWNTVWVDATFGNDSTGLKNDATKPFLTINAAKNAASAGDRVFVRPGIYNSASNMLKNGVDWYGDQATLVYTNTTNNGPGWGILDDRWAGAVTSRVEGFKFVWHGGLPSTNAAFQVCCVPTNVLGAIVVTNPASVIYVQSPGIDFAVLNNHNQGVAAVHVKNCERFMSDIGFVYDLHMRTNYVIGLDDLGDPVMAGSNGTGYYWEASGTGGAHFNGNVVEGKLYGCWWNAPSTSTTGNVWMTVHELRGTWYTSTTGGGPNASWRSWQDIYEMRDANIIGGGRHYVRTMKGGAPSGVGAWDVSGAAGELWLTAQKISGNSYLFRQTDAYSCHLDVMTWEDTGGTTPAIQVDGSGTLYIGQGHAVMTNREFLLMNTGTTKVTLDSIKAISHSTNSHVRANTNGLTLRNCEFLGTNTHFSITSSVNATNTVRVLGSYATTTATNKVTVAGGPFTVDSALTP
jgi:hypothetical protein